MSGRRKNQNVVAMVLAGGEGSRLAPLARETSKPPHHENIALMLPQFRAGSAWQVQLDTAHQRGLSTDRRFAGATQYELRGRSLSLFTEFANA